MLLNDLPYRQKYLTTCIETVNYLLAFSKLDTKIEFKVHLTGLLPDDFYFPEILVKPKNHKSPTPFDGNTYYLTFQYVRDAQDPMDIVRGILKGIRGFGRFIRRIDETAPLPTTEELYAQISEIYKKVWEPIDASSKKLSTV